MYIQLYPHNQRTYNNIIKMWNTTNKVAVIQPTGTGKSFLILKCCEHFKGKNKIILAPSNYILDQIKKQNGNLIGDVIFYTYATLQNLTDDELKELNLSLIVLDEFHRCGAEEWGKGVQRLLEVYSNSKVLGTSATPIRYLDNARDMSEELFNGSIACNMTLPQAIVEGILPMPKYISALYTFEEEANNMIDKVNKSKNSYEEKKLIIKDIEKLKNKLDKSKGIPKILQKYIRNYSGKYIVFCKNKEHMNEMKDIVIKWFKLAKSSTKIASYEVYSQSQESDKQLELFMADNSKNTLKLLFSIDMLNEGLHINDLDGVILLRSTISPIIYYQQIGRAIDAGRKESPLVLDFVNNFDNIKINSFKSDIFDTVKEYLKKDNSFQNEDDFISKFTLYDETYDAVKLFNDIENRLLDNWDLYILAAEQFIKREGHSNIPSNYIENIDGESVQLGRFRRNLISGFYNMNEERIMQLNNIGFIVEKQKQQRSFDFWFELTRKYKSETGNANIKRGIIYEGYDLGSWQNNIKQKYNHNYLSENEINMLKEIGFVFDMYEQIWNTNYIKLTEYYEENGNVNVPKSYELDGIKLGNWVTTQRVMYKKGRLSKDKIESLTKIEFNFDGKSLIQKKVMCLETKIVYDSISKAAKANGITFSTISNSLTGRRNTAGKHPETHEPLHWVYYDEYLKSHIE